jgi:hypothetical protein
MVALATDLEDLVKEGYGVVETTNVSDTFEGCDFDKHTELDNQLLFVCQEYHYSYSYRPETYILKSLRDGSLKVVIDDETYEGKLYRK